MEVEFFDSLEAAQQRLQQAMKAADGRVKPWQAAVKPGECFVSDGGDGLLVFGEVLEGYEEAHLRHYRFCRCHSVACPEGELGDVHVCTILALVSRQLFEQVRRAGWEIELWPLAELFKRRGGGGRRESAPAPRARTALPGPERAGQEAAGHVGGGTRLHQPRCLTPQALARELARG